MPNAVFTKVQFGKEVTKGTPVAATQKWLGTAKIPDDLQPYRPQHMLNVKAQFAQVAALQYFADGIPLELNDAYFQALPVALSTTLKGGITATETTPAQGDYAWDFDPSLTATGDTLDAITLQVGDDVQGYRMPYAIGKRFTLGGATGANAPAKLSLEMMAQKVEKNALTGGLSNPTATLINPNLVQLWVDGAWADLGSTEKTGIVRDWEVEIINTVHPKWLGNSTSYTAHGESYISAMLRLTVEGTAAAVAMYDDYRSGAKKAYRIKISGPQIGSGVVHSFTFDIFGDVMATPIDSNIDGNNVYKIAITSLYDTVSGKSFKANVVTNSNTF